MEDIEEDKTVRTTCPLPSKELRDYLKGYAKSSGYGSLPQMVQLFLYQGLRRNKPKNPPAVLLDILNRDYHSN